MTRLRPSPQVARRLAALPLVVLAAAACSGPVTRVNVGTQTIPLSLVLGQLKVQDQAPIGPLTGPPVPSSRPYYQPPGTVPGEPVPPVLPTIPPPPVGPCPAFDPVSSVLGVGATIPGPPIPATYPYRASIAESYAGKANAYVGNSSWKISVGKPDPTTGAYDVTYNVTLGQAKTTRVLEILPHDVGSAPGSAPSDQTNPNDQTATVNSVLAGEGSPVLIPSDAPNPAGYGLAGIYLKSQTADGTSFTPSVPIALLQLRQLNGSTNTGAQNSAAITSSGFDPTTHAVMAFRSTVRAPANVLNACGTKVQSVQVELSSPNPPSTAVPATPTGPDFGAAYFVQPAPDSDPTHPKTNILLFDQKIDFGLQYGGLVLNEAVNVVPKGLLPNGLVLDPSQPPNPQPSGPPPTIDPGDPTGTALNAGLWAAGGLLQYSAAHEILKTDTFTINVQPKLPKAT